MSGAFLMAEVPYGGNGFTLLLSSVSRQRRLLAEAAQNAVPRVGSGAEGSNVFVCRDVSQADTGRQGSARLVLANVDLPQLDEQRLERLQWKLERFVDSLDDLLPDIPQVTGRDCGPVVSARLREWEEELKVSLLPPSQRLCEATLVDGRCENDWLGHRWRYAAVFVGVLCLLGYWTAWSRRRSVDLAGTVESASDQTDSDVAPVTAVPEVVLGAQQRAGLEPKAEESRRIAGRPAAARPELAPFAELLRNWERENLSPVSAVDKLYAELVRRGWNPGASDTGPQEIADWLGDLWLRAPMAGEQLDLEGEWQRAAANLKQFGDVAGMPNFAGRNGLADKLLEVRGRFERDLLIALKYARETRLITNAAHIFQFGGGGTDEVKFTEMLAKDVAVRSAGNETVTGASAVVAWRQIVTTDGVLNQAFDKIRNFDAVDPKVRDLAEKFHLLLETLDGLLSADLQLGVRTEKLNSLGTVNLVDFSNLSFRVVDLLHSTSLPIQVGNREYTVGGRAGREYWRQLLARGTKGRPATKDVTNFQKENGDPVEVISLTFGDSGGSNASWLKLREDFREQLQSFDESLKQAEAAVPGEITEKLNR